MRWLLAMSLLGGLLLASACPTTPAAIIDDELDTCAEVCQTYQQTFDTEFDFDACTVECEAALDADEAFADTIRACGGCIDALDLGEVFACDAECEGVLF